MNHYYKSVLAAIAAALCLLTCGCSNSSVPAPSPAPTEAPALPRVISVEEAKSIIDGSSDYLLLDVRDRDEFESGHIPGSICIPYTELESRRSELPDSPDAAILVYCRSGRRSAIAAGTLAELGYRNVLDFGGILDWPYEVTDVGNSDAADCSHVWQAYDCSYERCEKCGRLRNYE